MKLSGLKRWPKDPQRTLSMVPGSKSTMMALGTYLLAEERQGDFKGVTQMTFILLSITVYRNMSFCHLKIIFSYQFLLSILSEFTYWYTSAVVDSHGCYSSFFPLALSQKPERLTVDINLSSCGTVTTAALVVTAEAAASSFIFRNL